MTLKLMLPLRCLALGGLSLATATWAWADELPVPETVQTAPPISGVLPGVVQYASGWPEGEGLPCDNCGRHHGRSGYPSPLCDWLCSPCDMTQRFTYWPKDHGHYYFRPYHMYRVEQQRHMAAAWGEDPRNPYAHTVFERVYEQLRSESGAEVLPMTPETPPVPMEGTLPAPPIPRVPPTPEPEEPEEQPSEAKSSPARKRSLLRPVSIGSVKP